MRGPVREKRFLPLSSISNHRIAKKLPLISCLFIPSLKNNTVRMTMYLTSVLHWITWFNLLTACQAKAKPNNLPVTDKSGMLVPVESELGSSLEMPSPSSDQSINRPINEPNNLPVTDKSGMLVPMKSELDSPLYRSSSDFHQTIKLRVEKTSPDNAEEFSTSRHLLKLPVNRHGTRRMAAIDDGLNVVKRVVGGEMSRPEQWPWLVSLRLLRNGTLWKHSCGGSLIHSQWVLSAAHCFEKNWTNFVIGDATRWKARVGEYNLYEDDATQLDVQVEKIIFHPKRSVRNITETKMDIVLLKLASPVTLGEAVNVISLPSAEENFPPGTSCVISGWGFTEDGGNVSDKVRHVVVPVLSSALCTTLYDKKPGTSKTVIAEDRLCAGFQEGGKDACQADSGGPLVHYDNSKLQWVLVGVISRGYGCARPGFPGVYSRVSYFVPWIDKTIAEN